MGLLTKTLLKRFAKVGEQDVPNPIIVAKFLTHAGRGPGMPLVIYPMKGYFWGGRKLFRAEANGATSHWTSCNPIRVLLV